MLTNIIIPHGIANLHDAGALIDALDALKAAGRELPFTIERYADEEGWKAGRASHIGASEAATVMGLTEGWKTRRQLFDEKTGRAASEFKGNELTRFGQSCEPLIRAMWALEHPDFDCYDPTHLIFVSEARPWQSCSLDLVAVERATGRVFIVEIKTGVYSAKWSGEYCPDNYFIQLCHELDVTGFDGVSLVGRIRSLEMGFERNGWGKDYFFWATNPALIDQQARVREAEEKFADDIRRGVLRPTLNLCI